MKEVELWERAIAEPKEARYFWGLMESTVLKRKRKRTLNEPLESA